MPLSLHKFSVASALVFSIALSACAPIPLQPSEMTNANMALSEADSAGSPADAQALLLQTADYFLLQDKPEEARKILQSRYFETFPNSSLQWQHRLIAMSAATRLDDQSWAMELSDKTAPADFLEYAPGMRPQAINMMADTYRLAGRSLAEARLLIMTDAAESGLSPQEISDRIWTALNNIPEADLRSPDQREASPEAEGWFELALRLRDRDLSTEQQTRIIRDWQQQWPGHPASEPLPAELALAMQLINDRPRSIVVALPLSGSLKTAGEMIRNGFMASFYADPSAVEAGISVRFADTEAKAFKEIYKEAAVSGKTDLVIGPLRKQQLEAFDFQKQLDVPVLALNYLPAGVESSANFYQYGLSAEDEVRQIVDQLKREGSNHLLALAPYGDWGDRVVTALEEQIGSTDGVLLDVERFEEGSDLKTVAADVLGVTASRDRAINVERTIGLDVEFEPRRRQDAQAMVMIAPPTVARQFKPLFAFYFAGDLPVYSPSIIYEGNPNASRDRDLNGIIFTDIPWVLAPDSDFRDTATKALPNIGGQLGRLFAMGADTYELARRLPLLNRPGALQLDGQSGVLTIDASRSVHREQLWAKFVNGTPRTVEMKPALESTDNPQRAD